jgi:hypothetical protein
MGIVISHSDKGNDMRLDNQMGVPIHNLFDGAAEEARGPNDSSGNFVGFPSLLSPPHAPRKFGVQTGRSERGAARIRFLSRPCSAAILHPPA